MIRNYTYFMNDLILKCLLLFLFGSVQACSTDDNSISPIEGKNFTIKVFYTMQTNNIVYPDTNSQIFIYYDFPIMNLFKCEYISDGKFVNNDSIFVPVQQEIANSEGIPQLFPIYSDKAITVVVESHYYKNRLAYTVYENYQQSIFTEFTFNP